MSEEIKNDLVPRLRFKQSSGCSYPDWEEVKLNTLANLVIIKNKTFSVKRVLTNSAADGIVDQRDYFEKDIANSSNLDGYFVVERDDYVYNPRISNIAPVGPVSKNGIGIGLMSPLYTVFRFFSSENDFYEQYFKTSHWYQYLRFMSNSGARFDRMSITPSVFMNMPVPFPKPAEQQKIADCLSSLDNLITTQKQKLEALKAHKKGLMQQLFPAEGETVPQLRFAEFKDSGDWEEKTLGGIGTFTGGGTPSRMNEDFWKGDIPWISSSDLQEDSIQTIKISRFISKSALQESATKLVPKNSILLVSRVGVGKLAISKNEICTSQDFTNFTPANDNLVFLAYYLKLISNVLISFSQGMAIMGFTKDDISRLELMLPTLQEQQKIANCLSSLDDLITAQKEKIETLKVHKKGLMQALFPCDY